MRIGNENIGIQERATAILMMKESVDALLNDESVELNQLRVPLRLLTLSLVAAAEETVTKQAAKPGVAPETTLLLRSLPGDKWRSLIEPEFGSTCLQSLHRYCFSRRQYRHGPRLLGQGHGARSGTEY